MGNTNAKIELLNRVEINNIKCASITHGKDWYDEDVQRDIILPLNYTKKDMDGFLKELDFTYDSGYGGQELFGIVWLKDNTWLSRGEYDGSEWWEHNKLPEIPIECKSRLNKLKRLLDGN